MLEYITPLQKELERRAFRALGHSSQIARLQEAPGTSGALVAAALEACLANHMTGIESQYVARIEQLRREMEASSRDLEVRDFGAGDGSGDRTDQDRQQGRVLHIELKKYCSDTSRSPGTGLLLMKLFEELRPRTAIELGTSVGISASYLASALAINGGGKLYTLEGAESVAGVAQENLRSLGLEQHSEVVVGSFGDTLAGVLERIGPVDFAFIDGHHDYAATLKYFEQIKPFLSPSAVVMFDDISWSAGMAAAWKKVSADPGVCTVVDLFSMGLCTMSGPRQFVRVALPRA